MSFSADRSSTTTAQTTVLVVSAAWCAGLLALGGTSAAQTMSNVGLALIALAAAAVAVARGRRDDGPERRSWLLLGGGVGAWGAGQLIWTWYESVLGREVPFPSPADVGYLGLPPLAAAALLALPLAAPTLAGRLRTLLDGLMVAGSVLLCSWILVLGPVFRAGGESRLTQSISLAYPLGDVVVITIVVYTWLRARHGTRQISLSLPLVGTGLMAFAVADSGFTIQTTADVYSSGNVIDLGWFLGFALILLAALRTPRARPAPRTTTCRRGRSATCCRTSR